MKLSREIKTSIIVIGGILLFVLGFSYLKSTSVFDNNKILYAVYNHIGGLQVGTPVTINGLTVGKVQDIKFKDTQGNLLVTFSVESDFVFSKNSKAELYDTGILGGKGIEIKPVFDGAPEAKSKDTLITKTKSGLTDLVQQQLGPLRTKIEGAVSNADSLLVNVNEVLDTNAKKDLRETISSLNIVMRNFKNTTLALNTLIDGNKESLSTTITNFNHISTNFSKLSDSISNAGLGNTLKKLESTVMNLDVLLAKINEGDGTLGKLMNDEKLYANLAEASRELDLLLQDFRLNPKRYVNVSVFGKKQKEYDLPENDPAEKAQN